jgi:hypothetical protein
MSRVLAPAGPTYQRLSLSILGRYTIANWYDASGKLREFACRTMSMSPWSVTLAVPVVGMLGKPVTAYLEPFGRLDGPIAGVQGRAFEMSIEAPESKRAEIEAKLRWLRGNKENRLADKRAGTRIVPRSPHSVLILHEGTTLPCLVMDMSVTGAAVSADLEPEIGQPLAVGKVVGRVVRKFSEGFAVRFLQRQDPATLERLVMYHALDRTKSPPRALVAT